MDLHNLEGYELGKFLSSLPYAIQVKVLEGLRDGHDELRHRGTCNETVFPNWYLTRAIESLARLGMRPIKGIPNGTPQQVMG